MASPSGPTHLPRSFEELFQLVLKSELPQTEIQAWKSKLTTSFPTEDASTMQALFEIACAKKDDWSNQVRALKGSKCSSAGSELIVRVEQSAKTLPLQKSEKPEGADATSDQLLAEKMLASCPECKSSSYLNLNQRAAPFITILRNRNLPMADFVKTSDTLAPLLAYEALSVMPKAIVSVESPLAETKGVKMNENVLLVPIMRSGISLLSTFRDRFPGSHVGFLDIKRDEKTVDKRPVLNFDLIPPIAPDTRVIVLEPMLATGGSLNKTLSLLIEKGARPENILCIHVIAAVEGYNRIRSEFPAVRLIVSQIDPLLNSEKFIVPGLGDWGDRYFGPSHKD